MRDVDWYRRPELILSDVLRRAARGEKKQQVYHRALVLAIDLEGGRLQNPDGSGVHVASLRDGSTRKLRAITGPANPRGSIKARIITDGFDRLLDDQSLRVYWPMFAQDINGAPITPGEHVYVMFDGEGTSHGLWVSRVAGHESANSSEGALEYDAPSAPQSAMDTFESNGPQYPRDDSYASMAPTDGAMTSFEED